MKLWHKIALFIGLLLLAIWFLKPLRDWLFKALGADYTDNDKQGLKSIAESQYTAMFNAVGTDEETLFNSLNGLTNEQLKKVYDFFGVRLNGIKGYGDLFIWYKKELSSNELRRMYEIWKNTGMTNLSIIKGVN